MKITRFETFLANAGLRNMDIGEPRGRHEGDAGEIRPGAHLQGRIRLLAVVAR